MSDRTVCPNCGNAVKLGAISCPHCGSDESTGWNDSAGSEHPDISPLDHDDYEDLRRKEFGKEKPAPGQRKPIPWRDIAIGSVIIVLVFLRIMRAMPK